MSRTNILILGKSGSGKSALLNFLWGREVAKVGVGRPVTPKEDGGDCGIFRYPPIQKNGMEMVVYDSWGMEADKAKEWRKIIDRQIQEREQSESIGDWFHTIIYCISAKGARIEDFEIESVIRPLIAQGNSVAFVLTKSDIASKDERLALREILEAEFPAERVLEICSVSQTLRNGERKTAFGLEALQSEIMLSLRTNLIGKIKRQFSSHCRNRGLAWKADVLLFFDNESGFLKSYASLHEEVAQHAAATSVAMVESTESWLAGVIDEAHLIFKNFGMTLFGENYLREHRQRNSSKIVDELSLDWGWAEKLAHGALRVIPLLNFAYLFLAPGLHRDQLAEKLDHALYIFNGRVDSSLEQIDVFLVQCFLLEYSSPAKPADR
jgi:tRNA U34 5-carboxymethylaminomethyl modifying GTPase MnmE/TrmE